MFKLMDKKIITIVRKFFLLNWPYEGYIERLRGILKFGMSQVKLIYVPETE